MYTHHHFLSSSSSLMWKTLPKLYKTMVFWKAIQQHTSLGSAYQLHSRLGPLVKKKRCPFLGNLVWYLTFFHFQNTAISRPKHHKQCARKWRQVQRYDEAPNKRLCDNKTCIFTHHHMLTPSKHQSFAFGKVGTEASDFESRHSLSTTIINLLVYVLHRKWSQFHRIDKKKPNFPFFSSLSWAWM